MSGEKTLDNLLVHFTHKADFLFQIEIFFVRQLTQHDDGITTPRKKDESVSPICANGLRMLRVSAACTGFP